MRSRTLLCSSVALAALSVLPAHGDSTTPLVINGQASDKPAITVGGETYVPLSALGRAGVQVSRSGGKVQLHLTPIEGGANQLGAVEGKVGGWLFNSVWRVQASTPELVRKPYSGDPGTPGWGVALELRNGSKASITLSGMGVGVPTLALADGSTLRADEGDWQKICFAEILPGASVKHVVKFWFSYTTTDAQVQAAQRLVIPVETEPKKLGQAYKGVRYTLKDASFRIDLR